MELEPVIGLEAHVHLNTKSKLFCGCPNVSEADEPNRHVCPVCMGYPGTLPVLNRQAVEWTILIGLALGCRIPAHAAFARKSYFYPDLPKGYQISQYEDPLGVGGTATVFSGDGERAIGITRVHLEEDAAKNIHDPARGTLVDYTRAGTPLVEIVTEPDIRRPAEAKVFLEDLQRMMRYLGVSNADMERGELRVDANVSLREHGTGDQKHGTGDQKQGTGDQKQGTLHPKTEVKNLNSFRAVVSALSYEIERQTELWKAGAPPTAQGTRGWDDERQRTVEQRIKEEEADYRYFPEPDVPPLTISPALVEKLRVALPELPHEKEVRFRGAFQLPAEQARVLVADRSLASFAENVFSEVEQWNKERPDVAARDTEKLWRLAANYLIGDFRSLLAERGASAEETKVSPENFAEMIVMLHRAEMNRNAVPEVLAAMHETGGDPSAIVRERNLGQVSDTAELRRVVQDILEASPAEVDKIRAGKVGVVQFLVGKVMAATRGRANPRTVDALIRSELGLSS